MLGLVYCENDVTKNMMIIRRLLVGPMSISLDDGVYCDLNA